MGTGFLNKTDLFTLYNYVQNTGHAYIKECIVESLREFFAEDSYYRYVKDEWGFPKTPSQQGLPIDAGLNDNLTTRLYIGEYFRQDVQFFPAILVKSNGYRYVPISMSRNSYSVKYEAILYTDGYNNQKIVHIPKYYEQVGAYTGTIQISILSRSSEARDELRDILMIFFSDTRWNVFANSGIVINSISSDGDDGGSEDRNDKLFKTNITLDVRSEFLRQIPIENVVDAINISVEIGDTKKDVYAPALNMTIETSVELAEKIMAI